MKNGERKNLKGSRNRPSEKLPTGYLKNGSSRVSSNKRMNRSKRNIMIKKSETTKSASVRLKRTSVSWQESLTRSGKNEKMRKRSSKERESAWKEESS